MKAIFDPQFAHYKLVLVSPRTKRVLAEKVDGELRLPRISIPRWTRVAGHVQVAVEKRWGLTAILLDSLGEGHGPPSTIVAEVIAWQRMDTLTKGHGWVPLSAVADHEFIGSERTIVQRLLSDGATGRGPFSRLGWIEEVLDWISVAASIERSQFTGDIEQFNASATSTLIRVGRNNGSSYWFKAVAEANGRECQITATLSDLFPEYLPTVVAFREDWSAWLLKDAGRPLDSDGPMPAQALEQAALCLVELQKKSIPHVPTLLASRCSDQRPSVLRAGIPELLPYLEEAMAIQTSWNVPRLGATRVREIGRSVEAACYRIEEIGVPDTLVHNDINLGNILLGRGRCVITDWAEASVGSPFATCEQLREQVAEAGSAHEGVSRLLSIYRESWRELLSDHQIEQAIALAPLIATATYLHGRKEWLTSERRHEPHFQSYARSMTRQMDRAVQSLRLQEKRSA